MNSEKPRRLKLKIRPEVLFAPLNGQSYKAKDAQRCFSQQPLDDPLLFSYLVPPFDTLLRPPVLKYGWIIGEMNLWAIVQQSFPEAVICCNGPDYPFAEEQAEDVALFHDSSAYKKDKSLRTPNRSMTLRSPGLKEAIRDRFGFKTSEYIDISVFYEEPNHVNGSVGLSVGTNYLGILKDEFVTRIRDMFAPGREPKWYLEPEAWQWTRLPKDLQTMFSPPDQDNTSTAGEQA